MIIPALVRYYDRLEAEGDEIAPLGYGLQQVSFKIVLNKNGTLHAFERESVTEVIPSKGRPKDKAAPKTKERPKKIRVCGQSKPSGSGINPCFLWDNAAYILGFKPDDPKPERTKEAFNAFRDRHLALRAEIKDEAFRAVCSFLESWRPSDARQHKDLAEIATNFGVFQIRGEQGYVHERPAVKAWWESVGMLSEEAADEDEEPKRTPAKSPTRFVPSLTTGMPQPLARLHEPKIKGVQGAQSSGATIVSFNQDAFTSYGKEQGANAPIGRDDAFKYCTALNSLTGSDEHRVRLAGDTIVFWSEKPTAAEEVVCMTIGDTPKWNDDRAREAYERAVRGESEHEDYADADTPFYILGLSPNASRLSVRMWQRSTAGDVISNVRQHVADLEMLPSPEGAPPLTIRRIINETAAPKSGWPDEATVSPLLYPQVLRAVVAGGAYPRSLLAGVLARVRAEGLADNETRTDWRYSQHRRCSIIRAWLLRDARHRHEDKEIPVSLDETRSDSPYLLGRLFAILERIQENGLGKSVNRTIKDSYFGSACTTPAGVFPRLLRLTQHHLNKIEHPGQRTARDKELGAVLAYLQEFPTLHSMQQQGLFAIGYYHQRQKYFTSRAETDASVAN